MDATPPPLSGDPQWAVVKAGVVVNTIVASPEFIEEQKALAMRNRSVATEFIQIDPSDPSYVDVVVVPGVHVAASGGKARRSGGSRWIVPHDNNPADETGTPKDFVSTIDAHTLAPADPEFDHELERMLKEKREGGSNEP